MAQKQKIWKAFCDKCRREKTIVGALPSQLEKALRWSPGISNEQKEVIRYILWNMVYVEGGTANLGENNDYPRPYSSSTALNWSAKRLIKPLSSKP